MELDEKALRERERSSAIKSLARRTKFTDVDSFINKWGAQKQFFRDLIDSKFLPETYQKPEQVMAVVLAGRELGIPPMAALRKINIIKGIPSVSPEMMWALARRSGKIEFAEVTENTNERCVIRLKRKDENIVHTETFTIAEAQEMKTKEAGATIALSEKFNWKTMPNVMLYSRCSSRILRRYMPDVIYNLYTTEEIADTTIDEAQVVELPENGSEEPGKPAPIEVHGVKIDTFDPTKEAVPVGRPFGQYTNSVWSELPNGFLLWLLKNSGKDEHRNKAQATLDWKTAINKQIEALPDPIQAAIEKKEKDEKLIPVPEGSPPL